MGLMFGGLIADTILQFRLATNQPCSDAAVTFLVAAVAFLTLSLRCVKIALGSTPKLNGFMGEISND
jgi:hypothetical protein